MKTTVAKLAKLVNGTVSGNKNISLAGVAGLKEARPGDVSFLANKKYINLLKITRASAVLVNPEVKVPADLTVIRVKNPDLACIRVLEYFSPKPPALVKGVHSKAVVAKNVRLGKNVSIQPYVVVQPGSRIGDQTVFYPNVYIGHDVTIGKNCCFYPNVVIREKTVIGDNVIIHSGTVIGSDGFGYTVDDGRQHKIPQVGTVEIGDDVEIGANVAIDRARFDKTIIKKGTKIDNLVHIAHNVEIGENSLILAQVGIAGSSKLGQNVIFAGQSGVIGHVDVGDNAIVAAKSVATRDVPPGKTVSGVPARDHKEELRVRAAQIKLPELFKTIRELKAEIEKLKKK
ncbi:MAG: UDP-3-O-(3-hydroxymyristoyl)glucosamine N-acyltransferase [Planctomycetes bacterium]|nr:UDP-3-O-(3-hydroxymyristoyl)glucosamine N-acyltransferase [Planctomycetota bacterium]